MRFYNPMNMSEDSVDDRPTEHPTSTNVDSHESAANGAPQQDASENATADSLPPAIDEEGDMPMVDGLVEQTENENTEPIPKVEEEGAAATTEPDSVTKRAVSQVRRTVAPFIRQRQILTENKRISPMAQERIMRKRWKGRQSQRYVCREERH